VIRRIEFGRSRGEAARLSHFEGFPYIVTKIVPALYHIILVPGEYGRAILMDIARRQVLANRLQTCLVFGEGRSAYFSEDGSSVDQDTVPKSAFVLSGRLAPCEEMTITTDLERRREALAAFLEARRGEGCLFGDLTKGGRQATGQELARFAGADIDGTPKGLTVCDKCGGWRGECLDPDPSFKGMMMRVDCWCENDNRCARCGRPLYEHKLNANYFDPKDGRIRHVPGLSGLNHVCKDLH